MSFVDMELTYDSCSPVHTPWICNVAGREGLSDSVQAQPETSFRHMECVPAAAQKRKRSSTGMTQQAASRGGASQDGASQEGAPQQGASPSGVSAQHAATSGTIQPEDDQAAVVPPAGEDANPCRDIVATEDASQGRREEEILKKQDKET